MAGSVHSKHPWSPSDIRGLGNYSLCCCVNALLQSFSATWELINVLEKWKPTGWGHGHNVPWELKRVLQIMKSDQPQPVDHRDFLHCLDRNNIPLYVQNDADEVFLSILNLMQEQMDDEALALAIKTLYQIPVELHLQCLKCASICRRDSYLLSLPLHIRNGCNALDDCVRSFFELQELGGDNSCYCAQCGIKTTSRQGFRLLALPPILCVQLKRYRNIRRHTHKLSCSVTFPEAFEFREILNEEAFAKDFEQRDCRYTLYAVIVHLGNAMFGHYTAFIRHKESERWFYVNDSSVEPATWSDVQKTYGGHCRETAYMLLYRRCEKEEDTDFESLD